MNQRIYKPLAHRKGGIFMVKIYTDKKYVAPKEVIIDQVNFFKVKVDVVNVDEDGLYCIREIDKAELVDRKLGTVVTPFGTTHISNLSTGCLTVLNMLYLRKSEKTLAIDVTLCGGNALEKIFEFSCDEVPLVLRHCNLTGCSVREYMVNDTYHVKNRYALSAVLQDCFREDSNYGV